DRADDPFFVGGVIERLPYPLVGERGNAEAREERDGAEQRRLPRDDVAAALELVELRGRHGRDHLHLARPKRDDARRVVLDDPPPNGVEVRQPVPLLVLEPEVRVALEVDLSASLPPGEAERTASERSARESLVADLLRIALGNDSRSPERQVGEEARVRRR